MTTEKSLQQLLIIDDDSRNIFALKAVLKSKGYRCLTAGGAHEGITKLEQHADIGVVLLDMMMPDMDGYEMIAVIRQAKTAYNKIPIVAVTAQAMTGDREKCLEAGADAYVSKPIDIDLLLQTLDKYLQ